MKIENIVSVLSAIVVLVAIGLARWVHPSWSVVIILVVVNSVLSGSHGFCVFELFLRMLGIGGPREQRHPH